MIFLKSHTLEVTGSDLPTVLLESEHKWHAASLSSVIVGKRGVGGQKPRYSRPSVL